MFESFTDKGLEELRLMLDCFPSGLTLSMSEVKFIESLYGVVYGIEIKDKGVEGMRKRESVEIAKRLKAG